MMVSDAARQLAQTKKAEAQAKAAFAVYPVYAFVSEYSEPVLIGTCFSIEYRGRRFLLTAAHVLDTHSKATLAVGVPKAPNGLLTIEGEFHYTKPGERREDDPFDFAWHELTESEATVIACVPDLDLENIVTPEPGKGIYVAIGYPISKNKISPKDRQARRIVPKRALYMNLEADAGEYFDVRGMTAETHLAIKRENRSIDEDGNEDNTIGHKGFSGGPLINTGLRLSESDETIKAPKVCGVVLEKDDKHRVIAALRLSVVLQHIEKVLFESTPLRAAP